MKILLVAVASMLVACVAPPVAAPETTVSQDTPIRVSQNVQNQVDILFMIDNSPSMEAMQAELVAKFPQFLDVFDKLAHPTDGSMPQYADLHIGVVTSDYGAGNVDGAGCQRSPGGQRGLLQAKGAAAAASCGAPTGAAYIEYAFGASGDTCNLAAGCSSVHLGEQFACMASVGAKGCGFEHQLESVYAALRSTDATNAGFLRADALLAVVFVTNEDDGSAPPDTDIFDPTKINEYGAYTTFRQTRFGVACGTPPALVPYAASMGPLVACEAAPDSARSMIGREWDVKRYVDLFTLPPTAGGIKADPANNVILVGIDAPTSPVETLLATVGTGGGKPPNAAYVPCSPVGPQCAVTLQHSCQNQASPAFFGDPPVRLGTVIEAAHLNQSANICGTDPTKPPDYSQTLQKVASLISSSLKPGCVPAPLTSVNEPDCVVEDVTTRNDGTQTQVSIPACTTAAGRYPCWSATVTPRCAPPASPQSISIDIERNGVPAPPMTSARVECSTRACPADHPDC